MCVLSARPGPLPFRTINDSGFNDVRGLRDLIGAVIRGWAVDGGTVKLCHSDAMALAEAVANQLVVNQAVSSAGGEWDCVPQWVCHDGHGRYYWAVHPDHVTQRPDQPNDQVPPLARLVLHSDSAGNPQPIRPGCF